jgi:hypothetical protein
LTNVNPQPSIIAIAVRHQLGRRVGFYALGVSAIASVNEFLDGIA